MTRRITLAAFLALAGISGQCAAFWPGVFAAEAVPVITLDYKLPAGTTYWTTPIVIEGQVGMTVTGTRTNGRPSRMVYRGPPIKAPLQLVGCARCNLIDLEVIDESGCDATVLITNSVNPNLQGWSTANRVSNVRVLLGTSGKSSKRAFAVDSYAGGGTDGNNEQHRFERCEAKAYSDAGFYIRGGQCHHLVFSQCAALDYGGRRGIGVHAVEGGYFLWENGNTTANSIDFKFGAAEQNSIIRNNRSEQSTQFVVMGTTGGDAVLTIDNCTWDCLPVAGKPVIDGRGPNTISIRDSWFSGVNGICPTFRFAGTSGSLDLSGVLFRQHGGTTPVAALVTCPRGWSVREHAMLWQKIEESGGRSRKAFFINKPLP